MLVQWSLKIHHFKAQAIFSCQKSFSPIPNLWQHIPVCTTIASKQLPCVRIALSKGSKYYHLFLVGDNHSERHKDLSLCSPWHLASQTNLMWLKAKEGFTSHAMNLPSKSCIFVSLLVQTPFITNRDVLQEVVSAILFNTAVQCPWVLLQSQIHRFCSMASSSHFRPWAALSSMWICWELDEGRTISLLWIFSISMIHIYIYIVRFSTLIVKLQPQWLSSAWKKYRLVMSGSSLTRERT